MNKVKIVQIALTGNKMFVLDDKGRLWRNSFNQGFYFGQWEQFTNLPEEPEAS